MALGGQKQRALLALLLLRAGQLISTERIVDELWAERPPKTATTSVQNAISHLRKLVGRRLLDQARGLRARRRESSTSAALSGSSRNRGLRNRRSGRGC